MPTSTVHTLPTIGEQVLEAGQMFGRAHYRMVTLAAQLDASDEWLLEANTAAEWIAGALDMCVSTAREWVRIGRALTELPALNNAFAEHRLSYSKVRAVSRVATPENESDLLDIAVRTAASRLNVELARYLRREERPEQRRLRHRSDRVFRTWTDPFGMICGFFRLAPAEAAKPLASIDAIVMSRSVRPTTSESARNASAGASSGWPSLAQQRADAFVALAESGGKIDSEIVLHMRSDGCTLDDGTPIDFDELERLAPTSFIRALIHDAEGRPVNSSGRRRHPTTRQKRVVRERDRNCVDCGSTELLQYDHNPAYELTRHTVVEELELRCAPCHRRRHRNEAA